MSHYPSSADLSWLRWTLHETGPDHAGPDGCPIDEPRRESGMPVGGAFLWERRYGSPTVETGQRDFGQDPASHSLARWGANDMRRRAFSAMDPLGYWLPSATWDERRYGMPDAFSTDDEHDCNPHR